MNHALNVLCCLGFMGLTANAGAQDQPVPTQTPPEQPTGEQPEAAPPEPTRQVATVDPVAKGLFEQAASRLRDARTVSFHGNTTQGGTLVGKSPAATADVRMVRTETPAPMWLFRSTGSGGRNPDEPPTPFDVAWDRQKIVWLDSSAKRLIERPFAGAKGQTVQAAMTPVPTQFQEPVPFTRELTAESIVLEGTETVAGINCDIVAVRYRARTGITRFWLGESDHLPRRIKRVSESTTYPNSTVSELTNLLIDEPIGEEQVTIALPDGYERDSTVHASPRTPQNPPARVPAPPVVPTSNTAAAADPIPEEFPPAPTFELSAPGGTKVSPASLKGSVAVLYFWGTWSLPSRVHADPAVQALHDAFKDRGVKVIGMSVREKSREAPAEFLRTQGRTYTNLPEADGAARAYSIVQYPSFVIIDREGRLRKTIAGFKAGATADELRSAVEELLGPPPASSPPPLPPPGSSGG